MSVKIEVVGVKEAQKYLNNKEKNLISKESVGINKATLFLEGEVKQSIAGRRAEHVSVDTGRFLNSVASQYSKDNGIVFSDVIYSKFLEYGTSRMGERRHFRNSASRSQNKIKQIIQNEIKSI